MLTDYDRAAGTHFNMVRTDPLEMDPLASSDPLTFLICYWKIPHIDKDLKKFWNHSNQKYIFTTAYFCTMNS